MLDSTRQRLATYLLIIMLLSVVLEDIQVFSGMNLSFYRLISAPIVFLLVLFSLGAGAKRVRLQTPTFAITLLFVVWTLLTCFFSKDPQESKKLWILFILQYFIMSYAMVFCIKTAWSKQLFVIIANVMQVVGLIISASTLMNFYLGVGADIASHHTNTDSLLGGVFSIVVKLAVALCMSIFLFFHYKTTGQNHRSTFSLLAVAIFLAVFFISGSRTGVGISIFLLIFTALFRSRHGLTKQKQLEFRGIVVVVLVLFITGGLVFFDRIASDPNMMRHGKWTVKLHKYITLYEQIKTGNIGQTSSLGFRMHLIFVDVPKVFNEQGASRLAFGVGLWQFPKYTESGFSAENAYLTFFVETGLIGGFLFLALILQLGRTFYKQWKNSGYDSFEFYLFVAFLAMALYFVFDLTMRNALLWRFYIPLALFFEGRQSVTSRYCVQYQTTGDRYAKDTV
jgi:O-antigen ligase